MKALRTLAAGAVFVFLTTISHAVPGQRGDINLNYLQYEIGDAVLLSNFLIYGPAVWTPGMEAIQTQAADVDCDGIGATSADLVYMIGIITGWQQPCGVGASAGAELVVSDLDTLRVVDAAADAGDTFSVEIYLRNADSLGAFAFRLLYDPLVIEPLTSPFEFGGVTYYAMDATLLRGPAFEAHGGSVPTPGVALVSASDFDYAASGAILPGGAAAVSIEWRVLPGVPDQVTSIGLANDPAYPESWNAITDYRGETLVRPTLVGGTVTIGTGVLCYCPFQADFDASGFVDATDLAMTIDCIFFCGGTLGPKDPDCPVGRMDFTADGLEDATDLAFLIDHVFFGGAGPVDPCGG